MTDLIPINYDSDRPTVLARDLHDFLEVGTAFKDWFPRMCEYGFTKGIDFNPLKNEQVRFEGEREVRRMLDDAQLTIDMAKEICMLQRNERGKQARQYFIAVENQWNSPDAIMQRALAIANERVKNLMADNAKLSVDVATMAPKAEYFDELVERNTLTGMFETAKQLEAPPKKFTSWLLDRKYVYRDKKGKIMPYQKHVESGLFELRECLNDKTGWSGTQTMITPKGRETFRLLFPKELG